MLRKIVRLRIFKFHARKFNYLPFPTTIQLGRICAPCLGHIPPKAAHVRLVLCIRGRRQGYPDGAAHYFHDGSIIYTHVRVYVRMHVRTYVESNYCTHMRKLHICSYSSY